MLKLRNLCVTAALVSVAAAATLHPTHRPTLRPVLLASFLQEAAEPTEHHQMLMQSIGDWEGTLTMSMPGMEGVSRATETITAFGPFWTQSHFKAEFDEMPMPYEGTGVVGYDAAKNEFVGTWIHNTDPAFAMMRGTLNKETGELEMRWEAPMPMTGEMVPHRSVSKNTKDTYESKFYMGSGAAEIHHMTISMKRKK